MLRTLKAATLATTMLVVVPSPMAQAFNDIDVSMTLSISPGQSYYPGNENLGVEVRVDFDIYKEFPEIPTIASVVIDGYNGFYFWDSDTESPVQETDNDIEDESIAYTTSVFVQYDPCPEDAGCVAYDSDFNSHNVICLYPDCATSGGGSAAVGQDSLSTASRPEDVASHHTDSGPTAGSVGQQPSRGERRRWVSGHTLRG